MKNPHTTKNGPGRYHKAGLKKSEPKFHRSKWSFLAYQHKLEKL